MPASIDFEAVFSASPSAFVLVDRALRVVAANEAFLQVMQTRLERIRGQRLTDVFPHDPDDPDNAQAVLLRATFDATFQRGLRQVLPVIPYRIQTPHGLEQRLWSSTLVPIFGHKGEVEFVLQESIDVTEVERARPVTPSALGSSSSKAAGIIERAKLVQDRNRALDGKLRELRELFGQAPGFMCFLRGPDHVFDIANAAFYQVVGHRDIIGKPLREAIPELANQGSFLDPLNEVTAAGQPYVGRGVRVQLRRTPQGAPTDRFVDFIYQPVIDNARKVLGVMVLGFDITQQKRTDEELRRSEERLLNLVEASGAGIWEMDLTTRGIRLDARARELMGTKREIYPDLESVLETAHPDDREHVRRTLARALDPASDGRFVTEQRPNLPEGEPERWIEARGRVFFDQEGRPTRFAGAIFDVTERKHRELEVLGLAKVLDSSRDFIGIADQQGRPVFINEAGLKLMGLRSIEEAFTRHLSEFFVPAQRERVVREVVPCAFRDGYWEGELTFENFRTGEAIPVLYSVFTVPDATGKPSSLATITRDLRAQKDAEKERAKLLRNEQAARADAEHANRLKDEFLAAVSHELRTPLTAILGWLHLLRNNTLPVEKRARALEVIERNARSQAQVIEDLLDVGRIVSGKMAIESEPADVTTMGAMAVESVRPLADAKGVRIDASFGPGRCVVAGDPQRLQQIVWNLLSNAVKFTPKAGYVWLAIERLGDHVEIRVRDTGIGIAPEFLPSVFERFRQAEGGTKRKMGGLGLGLSIVRSLVEAHKGSVRAYSEGPGKGALFVVRLPALLDDSRAPNGESQEPVVELGRPDMALDGMHVLVVDDESDTREYLRNLLEHAHARVSEASNARDALEALRETHPDVLVSDIGLEGADGNALIRRVRHLSAADGGSTPAVALTAHARDEDRLRAYVAGFQHYVTKPLEPAELIDALRSLRRGYRRKRRDEERRRRPP